MTRLELPWPGPALSPNSTAKLRDKMRAKKSYRTACWALALEAKLTAGDARPLPVRITLHQPTGRVARDADNAIAAFKHGQDGVARAIGVDDKHWLPTYAFGEPVKGGKVVIEIGEG